MLQAREIANQQKATFEEERAAQDVAHRDGEVARHSPTSRAQLAASEVAIDDRVQRGDARRKAEADGDAGRHQGEHGLAEARRHRGEGCRARGRLQGAGRGARPAATALVAVANEISDGQIKVVPDVLVAGGGGSIDGLAATLMGQLNGNGQPKRRRRAGRPSHDSPGRWAQR